MDLPGVTRNRFDCHGQRAIGRGSLFFENVRVPVDHRLGDENKGFVQVMQGFDFSRALIGLQVLAVARVALEETWDYVAQREAFGKPLSAFQGVSHPLADFDTQVEAARLLCLQTLWLKDRGAPHTAEAAMCKWWAPKLAYDVIHQCLLMFGHGGYDRGADGAAPARRARLPDRRRHGADHEDHHRAHARRPRRRAGLRPHPSTTKPEETTHGIRRRTACRRAAPRMVAQGLWHDRTINDDLDACVAACPDKIGARPPCRWRSGGSHPLHLPRAGAHGRPHRRRPRAPGRRAATTWWPASCRTGGSSR